MAEPDVATRNTGGRTPADKARRRPWTRRLERVAAGASTFVLLIALWAALTYSGIVRPIVLPTPGSVVTALASILASDSFYHHLFITVTETAVGGLIGILIGLTAGCIVGVSPVGRSIIQPLMVTVQAVPALVLAPLMLVWFGYGITSKLALVILATFFPVFVTTVQGIRGTPDSYLKLMASLRAGWPRTFVSVRFPYALPSIFAGIRASIASAFSAAVVAEFVGALEGLGVQVLIYNEALQIPRVFALVFVMVAIGMVLYYGADRADRRVVFWRGH